MNLSIPLSLSLSNPPFGGILSDTPEEKRRRRLQLLIKWLQQNDGGETSFRRIVARGVLTWGCKRETVREYLEDLEWGGLIEIFEKEDRIVWLGTKG